MEFQLIFGNKICYHYISSQLKLHFIKTESSFIIVRKKKDHWKKEIDKELAKRIRQENGSRDNR